MPTEHWKELTKHSLDAGDNSLSVPIDFDGIDMFAYPTNFKKNIGGINYNGYHFVHILDLAEMYKYSKRSAFKKMALQWLKYYKNWPSLKYLNDVSHTHYLYGENFDDYVIKRYLSQN